MPSCNQEKLEEKNFSGVHSNIEFTFADSDRDLHAESDLIEKK